MTHPENPTHSPENLGEFPKLPVYYLPERLGFEESPAMLATRRALTEAFKIGSEHVPELVLQYQTLGAPDDTTTPIEQRLATDLSLALARRDAGRLNDYLDDMVVILANLDGHVDGGREDLAAIATIVNEAIEEDW